MATDVIVPALGVVTDKVKILTWLKSEGDRVEKGDALLEIESDKVTTEITAPASGILGRILYPEGQEVGITKVVTQILGEGETVAEQPQKAETEAVSGVGAASPPAPPSAPLSASALKVAPAARKLAEEKGVDLSQVTPTGPHETIMRKDVENYLVSGASLKKPAKVSSLARKVAEEAKVAVEGMAGTGIQGRVMKADVLRALEQPAPRAPEGESPFGKTIRMNRMRQVIAQRLSESAFTAPHIYLFIDVIMDKVLELRETILEEFEKQFKVRLSINDCLIKAVAMTIRDYPLLNASVKGEEIQIHPDINVGLAVALEDGLIVPAIPQADRQGLAAIARQRADLVERARQGKLTLEEIQRGTFTITSLAGYDITFFTAIINPPQSGILSVGKVQDQVYLDKGEAKVRKVCRFGLSGDHRIIDGAMAAQFLQRLKNVIENPNFYFLNL